MALEQYARIVDAIVRGADELRKSLERAAGALQRQRRRGDLTTAERVSQIAGDGGRSQPSLVLDLDRRRAQNAQQITQALAGAGAGRLAGAGLTGRSVGSLLSGLMGVGARAGIAGAAGAAGAGGAGAAGAGAAGASGAGAGAAGAAALGPVGIAVAAIAGLAVGAVLVTKAFINMARHLRESSEAALEAKRGLAEIHPGMAAVMAMKDLAKRQDDFRRAGAMLGTTQRELESYRRVLQGTRELDVLGANVGANWRIFWNELKLTMLKPLNAIAGSVNKMLGWEAKLPKSRQEALRQYPMLRGLEKIRTGQLARQRRPPPPQPPFNKRP